MATRSSSTGLVRLPSGCFTVDGSGRVAASTLPQTFPPENVRKIGQAVLATFRATEASQVGVTEIQVWYPALKITARPLRGGAIIFLAPQASG